MEKEYQDTQNQLQNQFQFHETQAVVRSEDSSYNSFTGFVYFIYLFGDLMGYELMK